MKLDTTAIEVENFSPTATCVVYTDNVLTFYTDDNSTPTATEFHRLGNTWVKSSFITGKSSTGEMTCHTVEDVLNFNSPYDFIDPIFHMMAIASAVIIGILSIGLILKPFVRRI